MNQTPGVRFAVALAAVTLIGPLAVHLFLPVVPAIKLAFGVSDALAEVSFSITLAAMGVATLAYGSLSDRFGRRKLLLSGFALFLGGSVISAFAPTIWILIAGRLVQAVGAGSSLTLTRAIARDAYGPEKLVQAIAYLTMAYTLGPMLAPPIGGFLVGLVGWRSVFVFALAVGVVITVFASLVLHETGTPRAAVKTGLIREYWTLFADARFSAFVLQSAFCSGTFFTIAAASPFLMEVTLGRSPAEYGLYFFVFPAGYFVGNFISSRLAGRVAIEPMVCLGSLINFAAVVFQIAMIWDGGLTPLAIFLPGLVVTFSQGLALPNAQAGAMQTRPSSAGTAAGVGVFCQQLGSATFAQIYGLFADGTAMPMLVVATIGAVLTVIAGAAPVVLSRRARRV